MSLVGGGTGVSSYFGTSSTDSYARSSPRSCSCLSFNGYLAGQTLMDGYWNRVAEMDRSVTPGRAGFAQIVCTAATDAEAEELCSEHMLYFFDRCLHVFPGFVDPPGYRTVKTIQAGKLDQFRRENRALFKRLTWKDLVEGGCASVPCFACCTWGTCPTGR